MLTIIFHVFAQAPAVELPACTGCLLTPQQGGTVPAIVYIWEPERSESTVPLSVLKGCYFDCCS